MPQVSTSAGLIEHHDRSVLQSRGDVDAIRGVDDRAAPEAVLLPAGQFAEAFIQRVGQLTGADRDGLFRFRVLS
ncbi:MAG: hypothetical protein QM811_22240 [Pirellulales bacterium]